MIRKIFLIAIILLGAGCASPDGHKSHVRLKGSDTMLPLCLELVSAYNKANPDVLVTVEGGGTATGFEAIEKGNAEICTASRNVEPDEVKHLAEKTNNIGMSFLIAKDALFVYVNAENPILSLSENNVKDIFECRIKNWNKFIPLDTEIVPVLRTKSSGTKEYFQNHILNGENYCSDAIIKNSNSELFAEIASRKNAIGFAGTTTHSGLKNLKINGIEATNDNIINDKYPFVRYLLFYTVKEPTGEVKKFIDWTLSQDGQDIVRKSGHIPLWDNLEIK